MTFFECRDASRTPWFEDLRLTLDAGEVVVLSGPSGSGKTLFLRALADLDPLDSGVVSLRGRAAADHAPCEWRRQVVYLHQDPVRLPGTVRANLECVDGLRRGKTVGLPPGIDAEAEAARLSGGEAQRLALQRALALEPEVLLLDEASSALDEAAASAFEERVLVWVRGGRAALWVAHDARLASRLEARTVSFP